MKQEEEEEPWQNTDGKKGKNNLKCETPTTAGSPLGSLAMKSSQEEWIAADLSYSQDRYCPNHFLVAEELFAGELCQTDILISSKMLQNGSISSTKDSVRCNGRVEPDISRFASSYRTHWMTTGMQNIRVTTQAHSDVFLTPYQGVGKWAAI